MNRNLIKVGDSFKSNSSQTIATVIKLIDSRKALIKFNSGYEYIVDRRELRKGNIKDRLHPSVFGIGYIGIGNFKSGKSLKHTKEYRIWKGMLARVYDKKSHIKNPTYTEISVCNEWHNFQNFAQWYSDNYIDGYHLDKDILVRNNKEYSPSTCIFVPQWLNNLLTDHASKRGHYSQGVTKNNNKYQANVSLNGVYTALGRFSTEREAHKVYLLTKGEHIKECSQKPDVPKKLIDPLIDYGQTLINKAEEY
ncbi:MAG: hypothetical protein KZQ83_14725 [gamma proteobacterium symbiont of Taylorina sp.]|nr:hypothetical protein [gamma proteobacterium symbiont of Taylorina sp.]